MARRMRICWAACWVVGIALMVAGLFDIFGAGFVNAVPGVVSLLAGICFYYASELTTKPGEKSARKW